MERTVLTRTGAYYVPAVPLEKALDWVRKIHEDYLDEINTKALKNDILGVTGGAFNRSLKALKHWNLLERRGKSTFILTNEARNALSPDPIDRGKAIKELFLSQPFIKELYFALEGEIIDRERLTTILKKKYGMSDTWANILATRYLKNFKYVLPAVKKIEKEEEKTPEKVGPLALPSKDVYIMGKMLWSTLLDSKNPIKVLNDLSALSQENQLISFHAVVELTKRLCVGKEKNDLKEEIKKAIDMLREAFEAELGIKNKIG